MTLDTDLQAALADLTAVNLFVRFDLDDGPLGYWDGAFPFVDGGVTYNPAGGSLSVNFAEDELSEPGGSFIIRIAGISGPFAPALTSPPAWGRPVEVFFALMDEGPTQIIDKSIQANALVDRIEAQISGGNVMIEIMVSDRSILARRSVPRRLHPVEHRRDNALSEFLSQVASIDEIQMPWGQGS